MEVHKCLLILTCVAFIASVASHSYKDELFPRQRRSVNTKLRHSKHMMTRSSNSYPPDDTYKYNPSPVIMATSLTVQDNHKPQFVNCSHYAPSVKEEEPKGTEVFQVHAVDPDPLPNGGNLTYSFVSSPNERLKFSIHPVTGVIRTEHMFDRDEPTREKEVYLIVQAVDNGHPPLVDTCLFKVTITDVNDNNPVFDKANYLDYVPQDLHVGHEVMRISATDIDDGNNSLVFYSLQAKNPEDDGFFRIDNSSGIIFLDKNITRKPDDKFRMIAKATDRGDPPRSAEIDLEILVVESHKKAPSFKEIKYSYIEILESPTNFSTVVATVTATSNIPNEPELIFELVQGRTEQTNRLNTFVLQSLGDSAQLKLGRYLDYESINEYSLTIRVQNKFNLAAETQINVHVLDVNDNIPAFTELESGSVLEQEPAGTRVMQVRALDADGTSAHNQVTYELADHQDLFDINPVTGEITTKVVFDREQKDFYNVKVKATDNSESALYQGGVHNQGEQTFRIEIADKNDNRPQFTQKIYRATGIREDANLYSPVAEVKALDNDTSSTVTYSIVGGNTYDAFVIEPKTGKIMIKNSLDYENITAYNLSVRANDGAYTDNAYVEIEIENVNDNPPIFYPYVSNITIMEETLVSGCITNLSAYDPDIPDRRAPQNILYFVVDELHKKLLNIDKNGCLSLIKPLDRDPPEGFPIWQVNIAASDENGVGKPSLKTTTEVIITLQDINDNAPFLDMPQPVYWRENQDPGTIISLNAKDLDSDENGFPFHYRIDPSASQKIRDNFDIRGTALEAVRVLDREETKMYLIPIAISDSGSPQQTGTSTLTLIVADENDNMMKDGHSNIFVYNYKGEAPDVEIGRVYVEDLDDWDLPDKTFTWAEGNHPSFSLDTNTGMITMNRGTNNESFLLLFRVTEESRKFSRHTVRASVNVTVKMIPEEAVDKSGSIRFAGTTDEEFITPNAKGESKLDILRKRIAKFLNVSEENVDVFTVLHSHHVSNHSVLDVRFSAHGSPYYLPGRLNHMITLFQEQLERELELEMLMINIDECLIEKASCETSCVNFLNKSNIPHPVFTNTSSFVGVGAVVDPLCTCTVKERLVCLNGGTPLEDKCVCLDGFHGPRCELTSVGFAGDGWALYPPLSACDESRLSLDLRPERSEGLVFYVGPTQSKAPLGVKDFMALEMQDGYPNVLMDYGSGTVRVNNTEIRLNDGNFHHIDIIWNNMSIELQVDNCRKSSCLSLTAPSGKNQYLNANGPLQIGGSEVKLDIIGKALGWQYRPTSVGFAGCISNFTFNGKSYNLGQPDFSKNVDLGCNRGLATAYSFGIDTNFIVAILVCIAVLLILLLAVVVHRRKTDDMYKDADDIRENIINYEDEGGGEGDMTGYDLNVLPFKYKYPDSHEKIPMKETLQGEGAPSSGDICGFLDGRKHTVDNDPETNPFDDVRHYAYEGDGNSMGSLSSLASGTDEEDLDFDYLSNFGPRFRKLADMYGEQPSDNESEQYTTGPVPESWC